MIRERGRKERREGEEMKGSMDKKQEEWRGKNKGGKKGRNNE